MSENNVPMEVEEAGIDEYMRDFQGMLDRMDNPNEVQGKGDGDCAGGDLVVRESGVMGREGGAEGGEAEPLPVSKDLILSCPVQRSDDSGSEGVNAISPRDERGCVTEEVVENLSVADDFFRFNPEMLSFLDGNGQTETNPGPLHPMRHQVLPVGRGA